MIFKKKKNNIIALLSVILILAGIGHFYMEETGNFHTVTPGQFYRSAQLDEDELSNYIKQYKIKSIVNLRGIYKNEKWYKTEKAVSAQYGVKHYDFGMNANKMQSIDKINRLIEVLAAAPRPILVHCKAGADRAGLTSAIWEYAIEKKSSKEAAAQLSWKFLHLPYLGNPTIAMDKSFWRFVKSKT